MNKIYFVISDIHGFYSELMRALKAAGFRKSNSSHVLICCGDIFDRGPDAVKIYKFLHSLPKERRVLIRGNHEFLLRSAIYRGYFESHDIHNGTYDTVCQFIRYYYPSLSGSSDNTLCQAFLNLGILRWIFSDEWVDYWEISNYIFVHGWLPVYQNTDGIQIDPDWRNADSVEWENATWLCPWKCYQQQVVEPGKTIVCGHWDTYDIRVHLLPNFPCDDFNTDIFITEGMIALDACTVLTHKCNVLKIVI